MGTAIFRQQLLISTETERSAGDSEGEGIRGRRIQIRSIGGLVQVFRYTEPRTAHESVEWLRRRFRMYIWKQWKKPRTKVANLKKLGIPAEKAYQWGNSRLGYWRIAGSPVLACSITNEKLAAAGYFSILNCYESLHSCD